MDTSRTDKAIPQGDSHIQMMQEITPLIRRIRGNMSVQDQVLFLRDVLQQLNKWCAVSKMGPKMLGRHFEDRVGSLYRHESKAPSHDFDTTRAIELLTSTSSCDALGFSEDFEGGRSNPRTHVSLLLFLSDDLQIIAFEGRSKINGGDFEQAHQVDVFLVNNEFLINLIRGSRGFEGNRFLVSNAIRNICNTMYWTKDAAQKKADSISKVYTAIGMVGTAFDQALISADKMQN